MDLILSSARGGKIQAPALWVEVVRELGAQDKGELENPTPLGAKLPGLTEIRHQHHMLAKAMAQGMDYVEAGLVTGFSVSYISNLKNDPTFLELLRFYEAQRELAFIDVVERMKQLGLSTMEVLQSRLVTKPEGFANRELLEMAELMLVKGRKGEVAAMPQVPSLRVEFVTPGGIAPAGPVMDMEED